MNCNAAVNKYKMQRLKRDLFCSNNFCWRRKRSKVFFDAHLEYLTWNFQMNFIQKEMAGVRSSRFKADYYLDFEHIMYIFNT